MEGISSKSRLPGVRHVIGVAAGKGGVGKSMLTVHLGLALQRLGWRVGLLDADIYGPSLRKMLPEDQMPRENSESPGKMFPAICKGIKLISLAYYMREGDCASVRAPIANSWVKQFIHSVEWGELDCLLIDFPPGTGDIQLTLMQEAKLSGAVVVTTPQQVALLDVVKAVSMFGQMQVPLLGLVENMSYFIDSATGNRSTPFGRGGGGAFARENGIYFLGEIPIDSAISHCCDAGTSLWDYPPGLTVAGEFEEITRLLVEQLKAFEILEGGAECKGFAISKNDGERFTIEWRDGTIGHYQLSEIQKCCPCADCCDEVTGVRKVDPNVVEENVKALRISSVGRYALQFTFTSGCSKGIYPFELLRKISPALR